MKLRFASFLLLSLLAGCSRGPADLGYTPGADADALLAAAQAQAAADGRKVLVVAGGDWCRWCHVLDGFLHDHPVVKEELERRFVVVKVYFGDEATDDEFFARLPEADGYPQFWVVARSGYARKWSTADLERGDDDYDADKFMDFIRAASAP
jgi:hypothetical protein